MRVLMGVPMKISTDVLCTSSICLGSNRLVSRVVSLLIYVQSELKPKYLIFSSPQSGEEQSRAEKIGAEKSGAERIREERRGAERRGAERSREVRR